MRKKYILLGSYALLVFLLVSAFAPLNSIKAAGLPEDDTLVPVTGSGKEQVIHDQVNTSTASQKRAFGGEQYSLGRFERPFDNEMKYLPYLDIVKSTLQRGDAVFIYTTIQVADKVSSADGNTALYGLELDTNSDGRPEFLILAEAPVDDKWTVKGVNVWKSSSAYAIASKNGPSIPVTGSAGFDLNVFKSGDGDVKNLAWVRLSPEKDDTVEIAFRNSLIGGEKGKFVWRPVTDGSPYPTTEYNLHLNYTIVQAGSPLIDSLFYPLKDVFAVDNTCRVASGYEPSGKEPGLCPLPPPPSRPDNPSIPPPPNIQDLF